MKDKVLVNFYNIDGIDYLIVNEIDYNNKHYVYLVNENDTSDILIRIEKDDYLEPLEDEKEFDELLKMFLKKF